MNLIYFSKTRSELMDLEKRCAELQEECINLDGALKKSKQKEVCIFGLSVTLPTKIPISIFEALWMHLSQEIQDLFWVGIFS